MWPLSQNTQKGKELFIYLFACRSYIRNMMVIECMYGKVQLCSDHEEQEEDMRMLNAPHT